jgi:DNA-binding NarL/FixJ family response regulator
MPTRIRVYVVDDHPVFRSGLRQVIQSDPSFEAVGEAGDDTTALAQISTLRPSVVLVDVRLPQKGGIELVREVRASRPDTACIMLTMDAQEDTFSAAMDAGAQGYILKEDAIDLVLLGIRAVAAGTIYLSPTISSWLLRRQQKMFALKEKKTGLAALTATERRVLQLVSENRTNRQIADELFISHRTVETHRANICHKLELQGAHKLLQFAIEHRSEL